MTQSNKPKRRTVKNQYNQGYQQQGYQQQGYQQQGYHPNRQQGNDPYGQYQRPMGMTPRNQGRLDFAGAWLLMEGYQALTTKGKRRVVPLLVVALVTVGTFKATAWSARKLKNGVVRSHNYLKRGKEDREYQKELNQSEGFNTESQEPIQSKVVPKVEEFQSVREEVDMTGGSVKAKPFAQKLLERITEEEGVFFKAVDETPKTGRPKAKDGEPYYVERMRIGLDKGSYLVVDSGGLYDETGNLVIQGGVMETMVTLLNRYDKKYEKGLLVIVEEFVRQGKLSI